LVQAILLFFNALRTDADVATRSRNFGIAQSAVSVQSQHAAFRFVKFYGFLLKPEFCIPKFAIRFPVYRQVIFKKLMGLSYWRRETLTFASLVTKLPFLWMEPL